LWPEELRRNEVIWPLRFEFDIEDCLPRNDWKISRILTKKIFPRAGFQLIDRDTAKELTNAFGQARYTLGKGEPLLIKERAAEYERITELEKSHIPTHEDMQIKLMEIGKLQNFITEKEYPFDIGKLDVVWRRVINSVPTYVFEVQIGGDIYHALSKLKHAFDLWNSHIFIVATKKDYDKANTLLSGTFHEIEQRVKFIETNKIEELYERKKAYFNLEKELGI